MSSGFISEKDIEESKRKRQEEWEKVRRPDQPLEAPEVSYDSRSLFEQLEEQKRKKDIEFEESRKLKNMIKGLDDDEVDFLEFVDQKKIEAEKQKILDEKKEMLEFQQRVAKLQEENYEKRLQAILSPNCNSTKKLNISNPLSQNKLLKCGLIVKTNKAEKRPLSTPANENESKKVKVDDSSEKIESNIKKVLIKETNEEIKEINGVIKNEDKEENLMRETKDQLECSPKKMIKDANQLDKKEFKSPLLKCIGILPGIGPYGNDDSSSASDSSDDDLINTNIMPPYKYDMFGKKIKDSNDESSE